MFKKEIVGVIVSGVVGSASKRVVLETVKRMNPHLGHKMANKVVAEVAAIGISAVVGSAVTQTVKEEVDSIATSIQGIVREPVRKNKGRSKGA